MAGLAEGREIRFLVQQNLLSANRIEQQVRDLKIQRRIDDLTRTGQAARESLEEMYQNMVIGKWIRIASRESASGVSLGVTGLYD